MSFTLRLLTMGLVAYVRNTEEHKGMRVLVIDGRAPGLASNGEAQVSHIPRVQFHLADLARDHKQPAYHIYASSEERALRGMWILKGDDLELCLSDGRQPDGPLTIVRDHTAQDYRLVPSVQTFWRDLGGLEVHDACLDDRVTRLSEVGLVGRLRLRGGIVSAYPGPGERFMSSDEYMFTHDPSRHRQRMASCVAYETMIEGETVALRSLQRGRGLVFRPQDGTLVELWLMNEPLEEMMPARPADPHVDYDFELLYRIAKTPPARLRVPIRATAAVSQMAVASSEASPMPALCVPLDYRPSSEASPSPFVCSPIDYNPSSEASPAPFVCMPLDYSPSAQA